MRQIDDPCYKCEQRRENCHSKCEKYIIWRDTRKKKNDSIRKEKTIDFIIRAHVSDTVEWCRKHKHK